MTELVERPVRAVPRGAGPAHALAWLSDCAADTPLVDCGTSHRSLATEPALDLVWPLRHRLGISRVADLTPLDKLGIPVFSTTRTGATGRITLCRGKGTTPAEALASALFEAVEQHSAALARPSLTAWPTELEAAGRHLGAYDLGIARYPDAPMDWIRGRDAADGSPVWVPAVFPYQAPPRRARPLRPSTTGLASGATTAEAVLHAAYEVIERDATSRYLSGGPGRLLDLATVTGSTDHALVQQFLQADAVPLVVDLTRTTVLPTFAVFVLDDSVSQTGPLTAGYGTHLNAGVALRRALTEAAQARATAIQGTHEDLDRAMPIEGSDPNPQRAAFTARALTARACGVTDFGTLPAPPPGSTRAALAEVASKLAEGGYPRLVYTDLTVPSLGLPVVHVAIPGMVDSGPAPARSHHGTP
ncbi:hypothetical protein DN069_32265 [Streptacidiphilus pinicola]|uniref:YcaO domain-containing protein n=1 Tax=Streptacidiphilus pinicola TaxID=2219663 RepID=A0A2X0IDN2_9ACTN|nr:YcaO-like family protein [Streptacidiphilus pinicola]RAG81531.1 hypothetical protein DN069_32265 [Streptacidiphilus pinicola]